MRTPRDRRECTQVDFYPAEPDCPACQHPVKERYHQPRWIVRLDQPVNVVSPLLACGNRACSRRAVVYRPHQEDSRALRGSPCGLDVIARLGALRDRGHWSITKMRGQLKSASNLAISIQEVAWLCEVFLAWVTTGARQDQAWIAPLSTLNGLGLAMDGVQPEKSHAPLDMLRDGRSGRGLVAKTRLSSATAEIAQWINDVLG